MAGDDSGPRTLTEFLGELRSRRGLPSRIRLLARYWRQVRDLPRRDQEKIALALGSKTAWRHLEKFFAADGRLSEGELVVKRSLERMGRAEPEELRMLADRMRSGDYQDVASDLLLAVGEVLDDEADNGARPDPVEPAVPPESSADGGEEPDEEAAESHADGDTRGDVAPELADAPQPEPAVDHGPPSPASESPRPIGAAQAAPARAEADEGAETARRRMLREQQRDWRARRLLGRWIRDGELSDLDEALALAALLESTTQQAWCLGDLIEHWPLDPAQLTRVLDAAPTPAVRNRLARRAARA